MAGRYAVVQVVLGGRRVKVGCLTVGGSIEYAVRASAEKVGRAVEGGQQPRQVASPSNICDVSIASQDSL